MDHESRHDRDDLRSGLEDHLLNVSRLCLSSAELSHRNFGTRLPSHLEPAIRARYLGNALHQFEIALSLAERSGEQALVERFQKYQMWFREMYDCILGGKSMCRKWLSGKGGKNDIVTP